MAYAITQAHPVRQEGSLEGSRSIFVGIFIAFLMLALLALLCGQDWRNLLPGAEGARSVLHGVKSAVYTVMSELV